MQHSVSVLIINAPDEVLCHQRNDIKYWGLPGGMVEPGETPEGAAVREVKEETGLDVVIIRKIAEYERPQMPGAEQRLHLFVAKPVAGMLNSNNQETAGLTWATTDFIPRPCNPYLRSYLQDYRSNQPEVIKRTLTLSCLWGIKMRVFYAVRKVCLAINIQTE